MKKVLPVQRHPERKWAHGLLMKIHIDRYDSKPVCEILYLLRELETHLHVLPNHS